MKRDWQRVCQLHQLSGARHIDISILVENAEYDPVRSKFFRILNIGLHHCEFFSGIAEVATSRPDHHKDIDLQAFANLLEQPGLGVMPPSSRLLQSSTRCAPPLSAAIADSTESTQISSSMNTRVVQDHQTGPKSPQTPMGLNVLADNQRAITRRNIYVQE